MGQAFSILAIIASAGLALQAVIHLAQQGRMRAQRHAGMLDAAPGALDAVRITGQPHGYPCAQGARAGLPVDLRVTPDLLELRKLPTLWLGVAMLVAGPRGRLVASRRRIGAAGDLAAMLVLPPEVAPGWRLSFTGSPPDQPTVCALVDVLSLLGPNLREVELSPAGLRLTWLLEEAARGRYLLSRDAEFDALPVPAPLISHLCDALARLDARLLEARLAAAESSIRSAA